LICVRCGYCCKRLLVVVVDDPSKGLEEDNLIVHNGQGNPCKHLEGSGPGEYSCAVHDFPWYPDTPCFAHTQIESGNTICRMGKYVLDKLGGTT